MPTRRRTASASWVTSSPSTVATPSVGAMSAVSIRTVVVFPAPFGPSRPSTSPRAISRSIPRIAHRSPNRRPSPTARTMTGSGRLTRAVCRTCPGCAPRPRSVPQSRRDPCLDDARGDGRQPTSHAQPDPSRPPVARRDVAVPAARRSGGGARPRLVGRRRSRASGRWPGRGTSRTTRTSRCPSRAARRRSRRSTRPASTSASSRFPTMWAGKRVVLHVGAAESVLIVTLNGVEVGVGKDSHLASEFDITAYLRPGPNTVRLRVVKWSDATYIEDQDQWWHGGISRSVFLYSTGDVYLADIKAIGGTRRRPDDRHARPDGRARFRRAEARSRAGPSRRLLRGVGVSVRGDPSGASRPGAIPTDPATRSVDATGRGRRPACPRRFGRARLGGAPPSPGAREGGLVHWSLTVPDVARWTAETPTRHDLVVILRGTGWCDRGDGQGPGRISPRRGPRARSPGQRQARLLPRRESPRLRPAHRAGRHRSSRCARTS